VQLGLLLPAQQELLTWLGRRMCKSGAGNAAMRFDVCVLVVLVEVVLLKRLLVTQLVVDCGDDFYTYLSLPVGSARLTLMLVLTYVTNTSC
jgi:hypothetical protein